MRFSKDHLKFIRNQYLINKAFCDLLMVFSVGFVLAVFLMWTTAKLSHPPTEGFEPRQYSECRNINANLHLCSRSSGQSGNDSEGADSKAKEYEYIPNNFIKDKRDLNAQEGMWRATNVLGILTVFQVWIGLITVGVISITLMQTRVMLNEAKRTTIAALKGTEAAENTLAETKRSNKGVLLFHTTIIEFSPLENVARISMIYKNFGPTAVHEMKYGTGCKCVPRRVPQMRDLIIANSFFLNDPVKLKATIGPDQSFTFPLNVVLRPEDIDTDSHNLAELLVEKQLEVLIGIKASYRTVYGERIEINDTYAFAHDYPVLESADGNGRVKHAFKPAQAPHVRLIGVNDGGGDPQARAQA